MGLGTFWVLSVLGDMGLSTEYEPIRRGCGFMFAHQRENGAFCRRRHIPGQGMVWQESTEPCTQARIVRFLLQFGYAGNPGVQKAIEWLLPLQRADGMWLCREDGRYGCLRATLDVLCMAVLDPATASLLAISQAAGAVIALLMEPRMSRFHTGEKWGTWECLRYPNIGFTVISALDTLAKLGFAPTEPRIALAVEYLLGRQLSDGRWPMDESLACSPIDFGSAGEANKWITLDAMRVIKRLYS
jgi:squalene cyclase